MQVALTGATGFVGRYIANQLVAQGHTLRCWYRTSSDRGGVESHGSLEWVPGDLGHSTSAHRLVAGCDAVVHAALYHPDGGFRGGEGDLLEFAEKNILGTLQLIEAARQAGAGRFIFISTCAVHEKILDDRPLDETHPLWPMSHYGAHKAALEQFVYSYGLGEGYPICALRPTGVYGLARPARRSKWFELISSVVHGETVDCQRGGKEVHARDVARAVDLLLRADGIEGQAYNCCDRYISEHEVATIAKRISGSSSEIQGQRPEPKHQIQTGKLQALGMAFGGSTLLEATIAELIDAAR